MAITSTVWELEPHTHAKHVILRKYLNAWLPKVTKWNPRVIICDGFAGPGMYKGGEDGSPIIAIKAYLEHSYQEKIAAEIIYLFIEQNTERYENLRKVVAPYKEKLPATVDIDIRNDDYDKALTEILDFIDNSNSALAPTFAFIDPFGIKSVSLETIRRLMAHSKCEVFITFMMSSLQRFLEAKEMEVHCDRFFGCAEWRDALPLVGDERETYLRTLYQRRLVDSDGVGARYVKFFTMRDERDVTIYDLFFATNHEKGIDAMKDAMWTVDKGGGISFSDATDPNQHVLFSADPDWELLIDILVDKFGGTTQRWPAIEEAIRNTPFKIPRNPLKKESKKPDARLEIINPDGAGSAIKDHTRIRFAAKPLSSR